MKGVAELIELAAAIADGAPVDWEGVQSSIKDEAKRAVIAHLRSLDGIAAAHSDLPPAATFVRSLQSVTTEEVRGTWGPLEIVRRVGSGTYADVYLARDPRLDRHVALKLLRARESEGESSAVIEEARLLARVRHPNVVTVYGAERVNGRTGIWMEYVDGRTLEDELRAAGPFAADELLSIGVAVSEALAAVHGAGLLHRDVKAQNVLREPGGRILLSDFGTGRDVDANVYELAGTPLYLAPEVLDGAAASPRSDVYSVGVLLFHLATGTFPVLGRSIADLREAQDGRKRSSLYEHRPDLPRRLAASIERALTADPAARFDSAAAMTRTLAGVAQSRRRRRVVAASAVVGVLLLAGVFGVAWKWKAPAQSPASGPRELVLIAAFENRTGEPTLDGMVEESLERELGNSQTLIAAPQQRIDETLRLMAKPLDTPVKSDVAREICLRDGGIRAFVAGRIERIHDKYEITASVFDPTQSSAVRTTQAAASDDKALPATIRELSNQVRTDLRQSIAVMRATERLEKVTTASLEADRQFSEGLRVFNLSRFSQAEAQFNTALETDPRFASAYIWLAWTCLNLHGPANECLTLATRAMDLAATTSEHEREWIAGSYYLMTGQDERAITELEALLRRYPDDYWALHNLRGLYGRYGVTRNSLDVEARIAAAQPQNFTVQADTASWFLQFEGLDAARPRVERARQLLPPPNATADGQQILATIWTLLFPAHEYWLQGRASEAARLVDDVSLRPELAIERNWTLSVIGMLRLALGQVRLAETVFDQIRDPAQHAITLAELALARGDTAGIATTLENIQSPDPIVVSLLIRAGRLDAAATYLSTLNGQRAWMTNEIEEARGDRERIRQALNAGAPWVKLIAGVKPFLYSETLARAAAAAGNRAAAIRVLEETAPTGPRAFGMNSHAGFYWMRDQKLLADLYREGGQIDKARAIERDLLARLAAADSDYPLLVELKRSLSR